MHKSFFSNKKNVVLAAIFYTFLWGSAFPLVKLCIQSFAISDTDNMSKCLVAGFRFIISGIISLVFCKITNKEISLKTENLKSVITYGLLATALQYGFTYIGLSNVDGSKGAIFDQLCVFLIVIFSGLIFRSDKLSVLKIIGCVIGFAGVLFSSTEKFTLIFTLSGEGAMLAAALCQTFAYFLAKSVSGRISELKLVGYGQFFGGVVLCLFGYICGGRITSVSPLAIIALLLLAVISSVAYVLSLMPLRYFPASEISAFNLLIPIFGIIMSGIILSENIFSINYILATVLIVVGIILINIKHKEKR